MVSAKDILYFSTEEKKDTYILGGLRVSKLAANFLDHLLAGITVVFNFLRFKGTSHLK